MIEIQASSFISNQATPPAGHYGSAVSAAYSSSNYLAMLLKSFLELSSIGAVSIGTREELFTPMAQAPS